MHAYEPTELKVDNRNSDLDIFRERERERMKKLKLPKLFAAQKVYCIEDAQFTEYRFCEVNR